MSNRVHAKVQAQQKTLTGSSPRSRLLQRTCACGGSPGIDGLCTECRDKRLTLQSSRGGFEAPSVSAAAQSNSPAQENVTSSSAVVDRASHFGHDFSRIPVYSSRPPVLQTKLQVNLPGDVYEREADQVAEKVMSKKWDLMQEDDRSKPTDETGGPKEVVPVHKSVTPTPIRVDRIDIVDSPKGAIDGFPPVRGGNINLNVPGPFDKDTHDGWRWVNNVHQIHFHLNEGSSDQLIPKREIQRTLELGDVSVKKPEDTDAAKGGFSGTLVADDGPTSREIQRPSLDKLVVADAPGSPLNSRQYPFRYQAHFVLTVTDLSKVNVARIKYDVLIFKRSPSEAPTENRIVPISKEIFSQRTKSPKSRK